GDQIGMVPDDRFERVEARGLLTGRDRGRWIHHRGCHRECGPPEQRPGVDGRGPACSCGPDESTDTGMPVTSRRARPGYGAGTPSRPVYRSARSDRPWLEVLDVISVPRSLAAPSGKTYVTNPGVGGSTLLSTSFGWAGL